MEISQDLSIDLYATTQDVAPSDPTSIKNSRVDWLPLDILFIIFERYLLEETPKYPVETLLLVCKSWTQAAVSLPRLWSTFEMQVNDFKFWRDCISRRLNRCSGDTLIDIDIRLSASSFQGTVEKMETSGLYNDILALLTGPKGEVARRWRNFIAWDPYGEYDFEDRSRFFSFPTPFLQKFQVHSFTSSPPFLPEVPSLQIFYAIYGDFASLPDLSTAIDVTLDPQSNPQSALMNAPLLVSLTIQQSYSLIVQEPHQYRLSSSHPRLESLHLTKGLFENGLEGFSVPALKCLLVEFSFRAEFQSILSCKGFPIGDLREVTICLYGPPGEIIDIYLDGVHQFLLAAKKATTLELIGTFGITLILKHLEVEPQDLFQDRSVTLKIRENEIELKPGYHWGTAFSSLRDLDTMTDIISDFRTMYKARGAMSTNFIRHPIIDDTKASKPAPVKSAKANYLPLDILYIIFEEYVLEETPRYPVETLLLVCKSWMQAALSLPRLWSTFKMRVNELKFGKDCISRRLGRCPNDTLVDIEITLPIRCSPGMTKEEVSNLYNNILELLAGPKGEVAWRWRSFTGWDLSGLFGLEDRSRFFGFPTPFLETFRVYSFISSSPILPKVPSLRVFCAIYSTFACLPDLSTATEVILDPQSTSQLALMNAPLLVSLKIQKPYGPLHEDFLSIGFRQAIPIWSHST
ncbi:hypothetical protein M408DRAFT_30901 [Serendipita vermifera MAFF 305830]|uniref:F-box domain-containing protein n=1 Tax=Serendipita vermifera MAFF 305830 TaxID=933852 RepID=A0A0C2VZV0_SERVB|nr:hypothetical protein M408DRAFT_30901 [Serendipita vermifera MAFF 305830]